MLSTAQRDAWLELGGFVAAADGISEQEVQALVASAAGPEGDRGAANAAILRGSAHASLPADAIQVASTSTRFVQLQCLSEIFHASSSDGCSDAEWSRLASVASAMLGPAKGDVFVQLCRAEENVSRLRLSLIND